MAGVRTDPLFLLYQGLEWEVLLWVVASAPLWMSDPTDAHQPLEDSQALGTFFDRLAAIDEDRDRGLVRIVHLGASSIGHDDLTGVLRRRFQLRFGDGGAGLVMMQRYVLNYKHTWVQLRAGGWKNCFILYGCKRDGHYGLGGATFESESSARTRIKTRDAELGGKVSRFELWYAGKRSGGKLEVRIDGAEATIVDTAAEGLVDRYAEFDVQQGPHEISVRARGSTRTYGVVLETDGPGVVWDQFSMLAVPTSQLLRYDRKHLAGHVARRDPDLVIFQYGGNDLARVVRGLTKKQYVGEFVRFIERVRAGKPGVPCLVVGVAERRVSKGNTLSPKHTRVIVAGGRESAKQAGCAFFDAYKAMGEAGSFGRWRRKKPPLTAADGVHLTHPGNELMGGWIYDALMSAFVQHRVSKLDLRYRSGIL